jgi:ABC-type transport system involved in multi-copper enzyme maturation permease subunit
MKALLWKDARLHWKHLLMACAGLVLIILLAKASRPPRDEAARQQLFQFHFTMVFLASILFGEWLVVQERARRTILWLRTLPVSDWQIVGSKYAGYLVMHWFLVLASTAAVDPSWFAAHVSEVVRYSAMVQVWGAALLGCRLLLSSKAGLMAPLMVVLIGTVLYNLIGPKLIPSGIALALQGIAVPLSISFSVCAGVYIVTTILLSRRETPAWAS